MTRTLIVTGCTKRKSETPGPAIGVYHSQRLTLVKQLAKAIKADIGFVSAKYGFIMGSCVIEPYDQRLVTHEDARQLRAKALPQLSRIWGDYQRIIIVLGALYREVIRPALNRVALWSRVQGQEIIVIAGSVGIVNHHLKQMIEEPGAFSPRGKSPAITLDAYLPSAAAQCLSLPKVGNGEDRDAQDAVNSFGV